MEEVSIDHFIHEHPLTLIQPESDHRCYGCRRNFWVEAAYGCKQCDNKLFLHTDCAEAPREIMHSMHPYHTLLQKLGDNSRGCAACEIIFEGIGYFCTSSGCDFQIHLRCGLVSGMKHVADEQIYIQHRSHPQHQLTLVKKRLSFNCDACGTVETGRSYVCVACQYWIHEGCTALPDTVDHHHHHQHPLSLAFHLPKEYVNHLYLCGVCHKDLLLSRWVYHCPSCRYIAHIKCALSPPPTVSSNTGDANAAGDDQGLIQFPFHDAYEELIKPFVIKEIGEMIIPRDDQKHSFPLHHHKLSLVSSSSISEINDDDDEDEENDVELACDACTMPIFHKEKKHQSSSSFTSSSSSSSPDYKYMSCGECKYFLHLACFNLPPKLPSHPLHKPYHNLILEACPKLNFWTDCSVCYFLSNGLFYACTKCDFKVDIKCASLPATIKHDSHPHHRLHLKFVPPPPPKEHIRQGLCACCVRIIFYSLLYKCESCDFILCNVCALLPPVNKHEFDKHPLPLTIEAGDFYCNACEREMDPREWMYRCHDCDTSFHYNCFPATSGYCRNIKFGQQYSVKAAHPHPLTFRLLTTKLRCNVCRIIVYGDINVDQRGFHCSSCNFFMCLERCGWPRLAEIQPIDSEIL